MYQNLVIVNKFCQFIARHYTEVPLYLELHTTGQAPVNFLRKHIVQLYISKTKTKKKQLQRVYGLPIEPGIPM